MTVDGGGAKRTRAGQFGSAFLRLAIGIAAFAGVLIWLLPDWHALIDDFTPSPVGFALSLLGTTLASLVTARRWQLLLEAMGGDRLPFFTYLRALVVTRLVGQFVPALAVDLVGRGVALRRAGSERGLGHAATQVVVERLLDLLLPLGLAAWLLLSPAAATAEDLTTPLVFVLLVAGLFIPLVSPIARLAIAAYLRVSTIRSRGTTPPQPPGRPVHVDISTAARISALSVARLLTVTLQFFGAAVAVGLVVTGPHMIGATGVAQITGLVGLTPGGLGLIEWGWAGAFKHLLADPTRVAQFVLCQRVCVIGNFAILSMLTSVGGRGITTVPAREP